MNNLRVLEEEINSYNNLYSIEKGKYEKIKEQYELSKANILKVNKEIDLLEKVNILLQQTSEYARNQAKSQVEFLVTSCLEFVFENKLKFEIEIKESNGRPSAKFFVITYSGQSEVKLEPELSRGGGVVDVVSLALRIAFLETHKPKIEGPLMLDEPAKHVSSEYIFNVSNFLKKSSELFNRQIIMITHDNFLSSIGSLSYRVSQENGISYIERIEI